MSETNIIFDLNPVEIFEHILSEVAILDKELNQGNESSKLRMLQVATLLYHLREWICPDARLQAKDITGNLTLAQEFYAGIFQLDAFRHLQDFVNSVKHGKKPQKRGFDTRETQGFVLGESRLGTSFIRLNLFINDQDVIWDIINPVVAYYKANWFDKF